MVKQDIYKENVVKQTLVEDIKIEVMIYVSEEYFKIIVEYNKIIDSHIEEEYVEIPDQKQIMKHEVEIALMWLWMKPNQIIMF